MDVFFTPLRGDLVRDITDHEGCGGEKGKFGERGRGHAPRGLTITIVCASMRGRGSQYSSIISSLYPPKRSLTHGRSCLCFLPKTNLPGRLVRDASKHRCPSGAAQNTGTISAVRLLLAFCIIMCAYTKSTRVCFSIRRVRYTCILIRQVPAVIAALRIEIRLRDNSWKCRKFEKKN